MTDYKLVPVEPTPDMVAALKARLIATSRGGILNAGHALADAISAAPAAQGEPVGEVRLDLGAPSVIYAELYSENLPSLAPGTKLYAATQPAPDVAALAEAAEAALEEIENIMHEAYNSAYPVCCGVAGSECCGSPDPEWDEADQRMMDRLSPHQKALKSALAAHLKQGGEI